MVKVLLVDYGVGNVFSIRKALQDVGADVTSDWEDFEAVVLTGVGSFDGAISQMDREAVIKAVKTVPVLGICLGMQILFEKSEEGKLPGIGVLRGRVVRIPEGVKAPHMGWSLVRGWSRIFGGQGYFYFAHSYYARPEEDVVRGTVNYEGLEIPAIVEKGDIFGTQFHPEKSGKLGRSVLKAFLRVVRS